MRIDISSRQRRLNARLKLYYAAEEAVLLGQSYTIGNRSLTRANLAEIRKAISNLIGAGAKEDDDNCCCGYNGRSKRIVLRDW